MNLHETIAQLEQQAAKYTEAATALRALLPAGENGAQDQEEQALAVALDDSSANDTSAGNSPASTGKRRGPKPGRSKAGRESASGEAAGDEKPRTRKKRVLSDETRARLAESMRARHQQRREAQAAQES